MSPETQKYPMPHLESPAVLNDIELVVRVRVLARDARRATVQLVAALAEFDRWVRPDDME